MSLPMYGRSSSAQASDKATLVWRKMKRNENFAGKASSLIFGEKKYASFTPQEKKVVDNFQRKLLEEDEVILPNTGAAIVQEEIAQILYQRYKKHAE